jgi:eukaryotic-like serine/threonine-protein kinase
MSEAPPPRDVLAGTPYRFVRRLGQGTYGLVVEAVQIALCRPVVIKILHLAHAQNDDVVDRLRLEAQAIAALAPRTPHVVSVLELGRTPDGRPYIVMERLDGRSLKDELAARGSFTPYEAVKIAVQMLDGLAVAHDAGILHRDVKPDNVFLCPSKGDRPVVKLIDFGLAKLVSGGPRSGPAPLAKPTDEGVVLGTPRFFAPEQARGLPATAASDLYSTGVVLYTMLTGRDLFPTCTNVYQMVRAHLVDTPQLPSEVAPNAIPPALEAAVMKALEKRPADRHADARAFRAAIIAAVTTGDSTSIGASRVIAPPTASPVVHPQPSSREPAPSSVTATRSAVPQTPLVMVRSADGSVIIPEPGAPRPARSPRARSRTRPAAFGAAFGAAVGLAAVASIVAVWALRSRHVVVAAAAPVSPVEATPESSAATPPCITGSVDKPCGVSAQPPPAVPGSAGPRRAPPASARPRDETPPPTPPPAPTAPHRLFGSEP